MIKLIPGDRVSVDAGLGITKTGNVQRITESTVFVKHYNGAVVGYRTQHVTKMISEQAAVKPRGVGLKSEFDAFMQVMEKTLTPAELKKREEVAKAMERENPGMDMSKKMAIATATAKKVAEEAEQIDEISKKTAMSYLTKAGKELDVGSKTPEKRDKRIDGYFAAGKRLAGEKPTSEEKAHTVPKTAKEKDLAAMAHPKDKITHADVLTGRGIKREGAMDMLKRVGSKVLDTLGHGDDEQMRKDLQKKMGIPQTGKPSMATQKEDVHYCAKHVFSERFGEGMVVEGQHAEPNEQGLIEWYDVDFGGTVRRVMTEKVKVMHAEYHMNHKKMKEEDENEVEDEDDKKEMKEMSSKEKMKRGLYNKEETEQIDEKLTDDAKQKIQTALGPKFSNNTLRKTSGPARAIIGLAKTNPNNIVKKEEVELEEAIENLPGKATHLTNKDIRHAEHGIIPGSTTLRHLDGNKYEVRAGRAKGKTVELDKQHVQKLSMEEIEQIDEASGPVTVHHSADEVHSVLKKHGMKLASNYYKGDGGIKKSMLRDVQIDNAKIGGNRSSVVVQGHHSSSDVKKLDKEFPNYSHAVSRHIKKGEFAAGEDQTIITRTKKSTMEEVELDELSSNTKDLYEAMISYSDFQSKIDSHRKAGNQIKDDKYDKKKASYTVVDQEGTAKKITHTDAGVSQQHLGSMKRDDSDDKSTETKPKETRGRGRPAGSKSGARN